jgi:hypothetical protein
MSDQIAKITTGPHMLYTGSDGKRTYGITVEAIKSSPGYKNVWNINAHALMDLKYGPALGLTTEQLTVLQETLITMEREQPSE